EVDVIGEPDAAEPGHLVLFLVSGSQGRVGAELIPIRVGVVLFTDEDGVAGPVGDGEERFAVVATGKRADLVGGIAGAGVHAVIGDAPVGRRAARAEVGG